MEGLLLCDCCEKMEIRGKRISVVEGNGDFLEAALISAESS